MNYDSASVESCMFVGVILHYVVTDRDFRFVFAVYGLWGITLTTLQHFSYNLNI